MTKKLFPLVLAFLLGCTDIPSDICEKTEIPSSSSSDGGGSSSSSDDGGSSSSDGGGSSSSSDVGSSSSSDDGGSSSSSDVGGSSSSDDGGSSSSSDVGSSSSSDDGGSSSSSDVGSSSSSLGEPASSSSEGAQVGIGCSIDDYSIVEIGEQFWMAENYNCEVDGSKCYDNNPANCVTYGRLYNWATAMDLPSECNSSTCASNIQPQHRGICPSGWHIPSDADWNKLYEFAEVDVCQDNGDWGQCPTAGAKLKASSGWNDNGNGTDEYGFSALPGGFVVAANISFVEVGNGGYWWSSTEGDSYEAYGRYIYRWSEYAYWGPGEKPRLLYVRCVQN